ncbi:UNVERIFIED_CONTAM: hypothetical protein K2H54_010217 [Gekko kuhli]
MEVNGLPMEAGEGEKEVQDLGEKRLGFQLGQKPHRPLDSGQPGVGGHASPPTMFHIPEYQDDEDSFPAEEKELPDHKLNWREIAGEGKEQDSSVHTGTTSTGPQAELRRRIGSDPPLPESEPPDEVGTFRGRSRSAPPILWAAQRYGRELRRMSDEFHGALQFLSLAEAAKTQERRDCLTDVPNVRLEGDPEFMVAPKFPGTSQKSSLTEICCCFDEQKRGGH